MKSIAMHFDDIEQQAKKLEELFKTSKQVIPPLFPPNEAWADIFDSLTNTTPNKSSLYDRLEIDSEDAGHDAPEEEQETNFDEIKKLVRVPDFETYIVAFFDSMAEYNTAAEIYYIGEDLEGYPFDTLDIENALRFNSKNEAYDYVNQLDSYKFTRKGNNKFHVFRERLEYTKDERVSDEIRNLESIIDTLTKELNELKSKESK